MKGKYLRKFGSLILAALLLPGVVTLLSSTNAQAQRRVVVVRSYRPFRPWGWGWGYQPWGWSPYYDNFYNEYVFSSSNSAYNQGYHDGLKTGESDMRHRRSYDPERSHYFHDAGFGNYAGAYREGFSRGYAEGFRS